MTTWSGKSPLVNWNVPYEYCETCQDKAKCLGSPYCLKWPYNFEAQERSRILKVKMLCTGIIISILTIIVVFTFWAIG